MSQPTRQRLHQLSCLLSQVLHIAFHCLLLGTSKSQVGSDLWEVGIDPLPLHGRRICSHVLRPLQCRSGCLHGDKVSPFRLLDTRKGNSFIEEGSADTTLTHVIIADVANRCSVPPEVVWYAALKTSEQPESRSCASCWIWTVDETSALYCHSVTVMDHNKIKAVIKAVKQNNHVWMQAKHEHCPDHTNDQTCQCLAAPLFPAAVLLASVCPVFWIRFTKISNYRLPGLF